MSAVVFGIMTIVLVWAAFHNPFHAVLAAGSASLTSASIHDDLGGKSIAQWFKEKKENGF